MATLNQISTALLKQRSKNGAAVLSHINNMVQHMAKEHDWDAAARWLRATNKDNSNDQLLNRTLRSAIRAYFGMSLTLKADVTHDTGYRFIYSVDGKWPEGVVPQAQDNAYDVVTNAVANGADVNNGDFQKALRAAIKGEKEDPTEEMKKANLQKKAKRDVASIIKEGLAPELYLAYLHKEIRAAKAAIAKEAKDKAEAAAKEDNVLEEAVAA